ncbi:MAG TPA: HAMP domain-containing sensor histidine kinase [Vicinamibacterales bacterium]|nr:HAMP domain-containing sensor histidine kinase [Vicinamibacterales bacterium]
MRIVASYRRLHPMVLAIVATVCAAGLVLFLQYRAISALQSQTHQTLQQISEQAAGDIAVELRRILDGPVFETLTAVNHPELRAGRLDLVAREFESGLGAYPQIDRFFAWHAQTHRATPDQVLFYGRDGGFRVDEPLGSAVMALARKHAPAQTIYIAAEHVGDGRQAFLRLFWTDARRVEYFAILGFVIDPTTIRDRLFGPERQAVLDRILQRRARDVPMQLSVRDQSGAVIYGRPDAGPISGRVPFPLLFYPEGEIHSRLAATVEPRQWAIEVSAGDDNSGIFVASHGYGLASVSLLLMLVALGLTVQAHRRSAELAQMQAEFVAHVSHQLKTPLSLLSAATETLQMDRVRSPERFGEYLATIHAEAARLSSLVQRILEFSRVQQQRSYEFERVDLGHLARETVDAFARGLSHRAFRCEVQHGAGGPYVRADPAALEQVLANLLDNAVKYSSPDSVVSVRVHANRTRAVLEVSDQGVGITPADQKHMFDRFYRGSGVGNRQGFGLGLTIVRELLQVHGGDVHVNSEPGRGSTFRVMLPLHSSEVRVAGRSVDPAEVNP